MGCRGRISALRCCRRGRRLVENLADVSGFACKTALYRNGRCWIRTSDLCRVKAGLDRSSRTGGSVKILGNRGRRTHGVVNAPTSLGRPGAYGCSTVAAEEPGVAVARPLGIEILPANSKILWGALGRTRTCDLLIRSQALYPAGLPEIMRLALKPATGAGKITVMVMLIAWQTINAVRRPQSKRFTRGFLIVAPGITIRVRPLGLRGVDRGLPDRVRLRGESRSRARPDDQRF